jgi:hypothetical protein
MRRSTTSVSERARALVCTLALAGAGVAGCLTAQTQNPWEAARLSLEQALSYLENETPVTDGHRERAIALIQDAVTEVEAAMRTGS